MPKHVPNSHHGAGPPPVEVVPLRDGSEPRDDDAIGRFFDMSLDLCCIAGLDGYFKRVNRAFSQLGYSVCELLAKPFWELIHPDDVVATTNELEKLSRGVATIEFENRYRCKDGSYRWLAWTASPSPAGTLYCVARDVTERKQRQEIEQRLFREELHRQRHQYQAIFDTLPQMIWLKDGADRMVRVNAAAAGSIGLRPAEVEGHLTSDFYPAQADKYFRDDLEVMRTGQAKLDIIELYEVAPGQLRWVRTDKTPYRDEGGNVVGVVVSATDVTSWKSGEQERARLYEQLREQDQLKTRFFANVSHELRTPLTLILGPVERLLGTPGLAVPVRRELQVVVRNAQSLLRHVNDLLDMARLDAGKMRITPVSVDLWALARATAEQFESIAADRHIQLTVDGDGPIWTQADPGKLRQVLSNVFANAFQFTPPGGIIRCTVEAHAMAGFATIEIADSGPGIELGMREAIFERFQQAEQGVQRHGGTGLGLSIAKELVALHDGRISAGVAPEGGALFTIRLPWLPVAGEAIAARAGGEAPGRSQGIARREPPMALEPSHPEGPGALLHAAQTAGDAKAPLVLVVEDNTDMNRFLAEELSADYRVVSAFDGQEGLELARALKPDLVLSDLMMPRLDGLGLVRALRADLDLAVTPVVLLTARADEETLVEGMARGSDDYMSKPFSARELRARVRAHLELVEKRREVARRKDESESLRTAVAARDEFLSVASHELRTPLSTLLLNLQLLQRLLGGVDQAPRERLAVALQACKQMASLVNTLLDVGRAATGHLQLHTIELDLSELLRDLVHRMEPELLAAGCALDLRLPPEAVGRWDRLRLEQVLSNLVSNALKFGPGKPIEIACVADEAAVRVTVRDHGVGIAPEDQARIFGRFEQAVPTRHYGGLGLGLWIAGQIVRRHGGTISVDSRPGAGSMFIVDLPRLSRGAE